MKKIIYTALFLITLASSSCNKWLDVTDSDVIPGDELFKTEKGHKQQLTGIYNVMLSPDIYGIKLSMGITDALAQYWSITNSSNSIVDFIKGDYKTKDAQSDIKNLWLRQYEAIANANILLEKLGDSNTKDFLDYDMMKGEALALRAFLHFDLLRLFGPVIKQNPEGLSIPYRTVFDNKSTKALKASEVMSLIESDLLAAKKLLANDPIKTAGRKDENLNDRSQMAFNFRAIRMNYYAVVGTLARLYQLQGKQTEAYTYAMEVINAKNAKGDKLFTLISRADIISDRPDILFSKETIFCLYDRNISLKIGVACHFIEDNRYAEAQVSMNLAIEDDMKEAIYVTPSNSSGADHRLVRWFGTYFNYGTFIKHKPLPKVWNADASDPLIPLIRLSEMYYIAAEAKIGSNNNEALSLLNDVRVTRELVRIAEFGTESDLREDLFNECRKEYFGEGQLFFAYKRLFKDIKTISSIIPASVTRFVLPTPEEEAEFGNN